MWLYGECVAAWIALLCGDSEIWNTMSPGRGRSRGFAAARHAEARVRIRSRARSLRLGGNRLTCPSARDAKNESHDQHNGGGTHRHGVDEDDGDPLCPYPVPVVEAKANLAHHEDSGAPIVRNANLASLQQTSEWAAASIDLHPVLALGERDEQSVWRPPDVATLVKEAIELGARHQEEASAENHQETSGHRSSPPFTCRLPPPDPVP